MFQDKLKLKFDDSFFSEEIRDGFCVTTKLKKIWAVEIDLLAQLLSICSKYNIKISAWAGTLLGAVRHKGFIPWDDDLDVCLIRSEYEKLLKVAPNEFKYPYFFQTAITDQEYFCPYARLRNSETTGIIAWNYSPNYNNGIYIDVYVMDGYPDDDILLKKQLKVLRNISKKIDCCFPVTRKHNAGLIWKLRYFKYLLRYPLVVFNKKFYGYEKYLKNYNEVITKYEECSHNVGLVTHGEDILKKHWCEKADLSDLVVVPFEKINIPIPKNYDEILTHMYGNYMDFPPIEKRGLWHDNVIIFNPDVSYKKFFQMNLKPW